MAVKHVCDICGKSADYAIQSKSAVLEPRKGKGQLIATLTFSKETLYPGYDRNIELCERCVDQVATMFAKAILKRKA